MRGKLLFVAGLATGYVFGSRAGRQRYEQIKSGWLSLYHTDPVQRQVVRVQDFAKARVSEVPGLLASGVRGVARVVAGTPEESAPVKAASTTAATAKAKPAKAKPATTKPATTKSATTKSAAKKPAAKAATTSTAATSARKKPAAKKSASSSEKN